MIESSGLRGVVGNVSQNFGHLKVPESDRRLAGHRLDHLTDCERRSQSLCNAALVESLDERVSTAAVSDRQADYTESLTLRTVVALSFNNAPLLFLDFDLYRLADLVDEEKIALIDGTLEYRVGHQFMAVVRDANDRIDVDIQCICYVLKFRGLIVRSGLRKFFEGSKNRMRHEEMCERSGTFF